jgi:hypothetical protein
MQKQRIQLVLHTKTLPPVIGNDGTDVGCFAVYAAAWLRKRPGERERLRAIRAKDGRSDGMAMSCGAVEKDSHSWLWTYHSSIVLNLSFRQMGH